MGLIYICSPLMSHPLKLPLLSLLLYPFFIHSTYSQTLTQTVRGIVVDADSKAPMEQVGVKVLNLDTNIYATTDVSGRFRLLKVPVGRQTIKFSFVGYEDAVMQNVVVTTGKEIILNVEMREKVFERDEVVIIGRTDKTKANNELVTNSARNFQSEETERYAGSRGDPSKMVANYAGVATGNDVRNDIIVRGNSPLGVLWRLEGTDIPNPNHFSTQGATGGPISILNNNLLGSSDFLTGAFPAEYGNKMSAVFDLKMRNGNNEKTEFTGQMGLNGLEAGLEGPLRFKKDSASNSPSYLINYRYSTLELFKKLGISFGVSGVPQYQDLSYKFHIPTQKAGIFGVWGIAGKSTISLLDSEKGQGDWSFTDSGEDLVFGSQMGAAGLTHLYFFNDHLSGKLHLSLSGSGMHIRVDTLSKDLEPFRVSDNQSADWQYFANYSLTAKLSSHHLLKAGVTWKDFNFDYYSSYWSRKYNKQMIDMNYEDHAPGIQSFLHWQYRITDQLTFNSGLHLNVFNLTSSTAVEPRAGLRWQFSKKQSVSASFGMHSQTLPIIYYFYQEYDSASNTWSSTNKNLDFSKSRHYVLSYEKSFEKDYRIKLEGYFQDLYNLPIEANKSSSFSTVNVGSEIDGITMNDSLTNSGVGKNYGGELTIEKFFSKGFYFLNSFSLYESKYKGSDEKWRNTGFSGGYVYNILGGVEIPVWKKNHLLAFDLKLTLAGGNRYTPIDIDKSILYNYPVFVDSLAWSKKFKSYQKIDLKISYRINSKKASHYIFVHIENILNRKNILRQVYNNQQKAVVEEYQLGLFPYGGYRIEF